MNPQDQIPRPEESFDELVEDTMSSVDEFIKELEAKERDLHITADLAIEVEPSEFDPNSPSDFAPDAVDRPPARERRSVDRSRGLVEPGLKTRVFELQSEVDSLHERIRELKSERNDIQEKSDRRLKDFESFKYRMDRERRGAFIDQITNLAAAMLPVLDNLDRALASVDRTKVDETKEFRLFYDGIALVNQQVNEVIGEMGVEPIKSVGERFDPQFHEAVATEQRDDLPNNSISEEMLRGYRIGNRVVRHSMVKVTLGGSLSSKPAPQPPASDPQVTTDPASAEKAIEVTPLTDTVAESREPAE